MQQSKPHQGLRHYWSNQPMQDMGQQKNLETPRPFACLPKKVEMIDEIGHPVCYAGHSILKYTCSLANEPQRHALVGPSTASAFVLRRLTYDPREDRRARRLERILSRQNSIVASETALKPRRRKD